MASVPSKARVVVIGAGIVGNSLVYHLARLGWRDIVQIDKGALPNPGGSTGHASNFIFPVDHSREITDLTLDSMKQYKEMGVFTESGGFEVARTEERMEELRRRMSSAQGLGHRVRAGRPPSRSSRRCRSSRPTQILGAFWTPSVGVVDSLRAGTIMRERALELGALTVVPTVEVTGLDVEEGRIRRVRTSGGDIEAETVVIACGVWSPQIAAMAGAHDPADARRAPDDQRRTDPAAGRARGRDLLPDRPRHGHLLLRAPARRRHGGRLLRAPADPARPREIPSIEQAKLSPTELPFTSDDFDPQLEQAFELMPDALGAEGAEIRYAINGLLSLTPDGSPILGETPGGQGAVVGRRGVDQGGAGRRPRGRRVDDHGAPRDRRHHSDIARFYPHQRTRATSGRAPSEAFNKTYGIVHPGEQWASDRGKRLAPMHAQQKELGAVFFEAVGWERPNWYASQRGACSASTATGCCRASTSGTARWWSPIINAEHLAMRDRAGDRRPVGVRDLRRGRPGRHGRRAADRASPRPTSPSAG